MALVRAMDEFPRWLRPVMKNLFLFFGLSKQDASLVCLSYLCAEWYEYWEAELPPHKLQFGLQGSICIEDDGIVIEGGEVKSSSKRESTPPHTKCFYLLILVAGFRAELRS